MDATVKERYEGMAQECAARACESMAAWARHGFMAGFFFSTMRMRGPLCLPSSSLLVLCLRDIPESPAEAEARIAFTQAIMRETMDLQSSLAERRSRLVSAGMAAWAVAAGLLLVFVAWAASLGYELSAAAAFLGGYSAWWSGAFAAGLREDRMRAAIGETGEPSRFIPWEDGFLEAAGKA